MRLHIQTCALTLILVSSAIPAIAECSPDEQAKKKQVIHRALINIYRFQRRTHDAEKEYPKLIKLRPNDARLRMEFGSFLAVHGKQKSGVKSLRKAVSLDPKNARAAGTLGLVYLGMKRFDEAEVWLDKACKLGLKEEYEKLLLDVKHLKQYRQKQGDFQRPIGHPVSLISDLFSSET